MTRARLVIHGLRAADPGVREAVKLVRDSGVDLDVRVTWEDGDATHFAREALQAGYDRVIAGGGDGTVNEVLAGMIDCRLAATAVSSTALAILPLGTANDFARSVGIPLQDPAAALTFACTAAPSMVDVGCVNDRLFLNVASGGFGADVTNRTPPQLKKALGGLAYSLVGIATALELVPYQCTLQSSDGTNPPTEQFDVAILAVGNGRQAGGGYQVTPRAKLTDGLLDLVLVPAVEVSNWMALAGEYMNPGQEALEHLVYRQLDAFALSFDRDLTLNLDGQPLVATEFQFRVLRGVLPLVIPADDINCGAMLS